MPAETIETRGTVQIRALMEKWVDAVRARDAAALTSDLSPDVLVFDLVTPLKYSGADAVKKRAEAWLSQFDGPVDYEIRDLQITSGEDVAFCHSLNHVNGARKDGVKVDMWWRATVGLRNVGGRWFVTHEHSSSPFDMETGKTALNAKP